MLTLGCDPDLHDLSFATWDTNGPVEACVVHVKKRKGVIEQAAVLDMLGALPEFHRGARDFFSTGVAACAVEAQSLHRTGAKQHKRPQDIVTLGNVAGIALAHLHLIWPFARMLFPAPEVWKGQIPKEVMQARLYDELGWGYEMVGKSRDYARPVRVPQAFAHISEGQWKHVGDAILLARWAHEQLP